MNDMTAAFAKLAGIRRALQSLLDDRGARGRELPFQNFSPQEVEFHFVSSAKQLQVLREWLPDLYDDFPELKTEPTTEMAPQSKEPLRYGRDQIQRLARIIDQIFETRANSELESPAETSRDPRVFISHGRAADWHDVQAYIERDLDIRTLELAQEPNLGRTVLQKLDEESRRCTSAVIVMTGDDPVPEGSPHARENVLHEIGFFQGKFGLSAVCLLHEEGTNIPSNIHGLVYIPFPKG